MFISSARFCVNETVFVVLKKICNMFKAHRMETQLSKSDPMGNEVAVIPQYLKQKAKALFIYFFLLKSIKATI